MEYIEYIYNSFPALPQ